jgi:pilus assembly protein FimV
LITKSQRWQKTTLATAAAAVFGLWGSHSYALSLGQIVVQSALGEPLRAEVDIPEINAEEESSLRTTVAAPDAFQAAGLEYNPVLSSLQISLQKKTDGRPFLRIHSERIINAPFVDIILEARWASGRIVSTYTILLDPPNLRLQAVTPTLAQTHSAPAIEPAVPPPLPPTDTTPVAVSTPVTPSSADTPAPASTMATEPVQTTPVSAPEATPAALTAPAPSHPPSTPAATQSPARPEAPAVRRVTIKSGDTATKIAMSHLLPAGVSLDQMLVAMLRTNPGVVIDGNINRIRAGAVMTLPGAEQVQAVAPDEARQIVVAQSKDFNEFRQKLAANAPSSPVEAAQRRASGSVQARVEDKKPSTTAPDKLTLSKGSVRTDSGEAKIAQERAAKDAASRTEKLSENIAELTQLAAAANTAAAPVAATIAPPGPAAPPAGATALAPPAPAAPAVIAPAPSVAQHRVTAPPPEPSLLNDLLDNPLIPAAAAGLVAALAGFGFHRIRQRKKAAQMEDSAFGDEPILKRSKK